MEAEIYFYKRMEINLVVARVEAAGAEGACFTEHQVVILFVPVRQSKTRFGVSLTLLCAGLFGPLGFPLPVESALLWFS